MTGGRFTVDTERSALDCSHLGYWHPDARWRAVDAAGHRHAWKITGEDREGFPRGELPTLRWVVDLEETDEYPEEGHYECRECGEPVQPEFLHTGPVYRSEAGPVFQRVTFGRVSAASFAALRAALSAGEDVEIHDYEPQLRGPCLVESLEQSADGAWATLLAREPLRFLQEAGA